MPEITPIRPDQIAEARQVIYRVAHALFHDAPTLEEAIASYQEHWPLRDLDEVQERYFDNGGTFLVMTENGRIIGTGAVRRMDDTVCEVKRLWFLPEYQGKGLGYCMMLALLAISREKGYRKARLATSPAYQPRAYAFYHQLGFHDIPRYNDDPDDIGMELVL